jgi:hypothetical protein
MVEKIIHDKKLYALIIKKYHSKKNGVNFFTPNYFPQQLGFMKHDKNKLIKPHYHKKKLTKILITTEIILIIKGLLRVDFYNDNQKYIFSKLLKKNQIIILMHGGHGFKVLKNVEMLEFKQGPYSLKKDKVKFDENLNQKIIIKK